MPNYSDIFNIFTLTPALSQREREFASYFYDTLGAVGTRIKILIIRERL